MPPPAEVEEEMESPGEEDFISRASESAAARSPDQSAKPISDRNVETHMSGDESAAPFLGPADVNMSDRLSAEEAHITKPAAGSATATSTSTLATTTQVIDNRSSADDTDIDNPSNPRSSTGAPEPHTIASVVVPSSLSINRPQQTSSETRSSVQPSPVPAAKSATSNAAGPIRLHKELAGLKTAIEDASPEALHQILRQEWRVLLFSPLDEAHVGFVLRTCFKNASAGIVDRGINEALSHEHFRPAIVQSALKHVTVDQLLTQVDRQTMDEAIAQRLQSAPAQTIVNWLAGAGRLGYTVDDYIDGDEQVLPPDDQGDVLQPISHGALQRRAEDVVMREAQQAHDLDTLSAIKDPLLLEQEKNAALLHQKLINRRQAEELKAQHAANAPESRTCQKCGFAPPTRSGYAFHMKDMPCERTIPQKGWGAICDNCGKGFTQKTGLYYHLAKDVCGSRLKGNIDEVPPAATLHYLNGSGVAPSPRPDGPSFAPPRPTFSTGSRSSTTATAPMPAQVPRALPVAEVQIPRPPLHTPAPHSMVPRSSPKVGRPRKNIDTPTNPVAVQDLDPDARINPSQLSPKKKAALEGKLAAEEERYISLLAAINPQLPLEDQEQRRISLKKNNGVRKSQIRKSFGVTLRPREKDKTASQYVAQNSSPAPTAAPTYGAPHSSSHSPSHVSTPSSSYSPTIPTNSPAPGRPIPPPVPSQKQSGPASTQNTNSPHTSSFGVLRPQYQVRHQPAPLTRQTFAQAQSQHHSNKRQRTSSDTASSRTQTPNGLGPFGSGSTMQQLSSEDAGSKYTKKVPVGAAQALWKGLQPKNGTEQNAAKRKAADDGAEPTGSVTAGLGFRAEPIQIDSSSESESEEIVSIPTVVVPARKPAGVAAADRPLPSTEDTSSEMESGASRPASAGGMRGGFMAKRGGFLARRGGRH